MGFQFWLTYGKFLLYITSVSQLTVITGENHQHEAVCSSWRGLLEESKTSCRAKKNSPLAFYLSILGELMLGGDTGIVLVICHKSYWKVAYRKEEVTLKFLFDSTKKIACRFQLPWPKRMTHRGRGREKAVSVYPLKSNFTVVSSG